jgi:hypothetical protein
MSKLNVFHVETHAPLKVRMAKDFNLFARIFIPADSSESPTLKLLEKLLKQAQIKLQAQQIF